jgi:radical SAM protein with 4Fe4S-binding SPASM domain
VTLHGASAPTHDRVTGVPGSHARCLEGVRRLLEAGVRVGLKTMLMTLNRHELDAMRRLAGDLGVGFRFDAALFPTLSGERSPTSLRVSSEEAVADELAVPGALESWRRLHDRLGGEPVPDTLYHCAAGHTGFHVDASGGLLPCLMAAGPGFPVLSGGGFALGWREAVPRMVGRKADPGARCQRCSIRVLCGHCPAFSKLEMGDEQLASPYLCAMAHHRADAVLQALPAGTAEP